MSLIKFLILVWTPLFSFAHQLKSSNAVGRNAMFLIDRKVSRGCR